jgi:hypothetical protein
VLTAEELDAFALETKEWDIPELQAILSQARSAIALKREVEEWIVVGQDAIDTIKARNETISTLQRSLDEAKFAVEDIRSTNKALLGGIKDFKAEIDALRQRVADLEMMLLQAAMNGKITTTAEGDLWIHGVGSIPCEFGFKPLPLTPEARAALAVKETK